MSASATQPVGAHLRADIRGGQLWISARAIDEGRAAQDLEGDSKRVGVDRGRRSPRFFRVCGSRKTSHAGGPTSSRWPSASPYPSDAQSGKLRERATLSDRARSEERRVGKECRY